MVFFSISKLHRIFIVSFLTLWLTLVFYKLLTSEELNIKWLSIAITVFIFYIIIAPMNSRFKLTKTGINKELIYFSKIIRSSFINYENFTSVRIRNVKGTEYVELYSNNGIFSHIQLPSNKQNPRKLAKEVSELTNLPYQI